MPELDKQHLLSAFMDSTLSTQQRTEFERLCVEDDEFAQQVDLINRMTAHAQDYEPQSPPHWNRQSTFVATPNNKWWQWQLMPAISMAFSVLAIVMVVSGFQVKVDSGALTLSFAQGLDDKQVEKMLQQRLDAFKEDQGEALANYAQSLQQQQLDASTQLTNYLLASSRQERRQDFGEFIKFINEQRSEDQIFYARQLNQLQESIYANTGTPWEPGLPVNTTDQQ